MKPKYNENVKCPKCGSTETVGLSYDDGHGNVYQNLLWCECGKVTVSLAEGMTLTVVRS